MVQGLHVCVLFSACACVCSTLCANIVFEDVYLKRCTYCQYSVCFWLCDAAFQSGLQLTGFIGLAGHSAFTDLHMLTFTLFLGQCGSLWLKGWIMKGTKTPRPFWSIQTPRPFWSTQTQVVFSQSGWLRSHLISDSVVSPSFQLLLILVTATSRSFII